MLAYTFRRIDTETTDTLDFAAGELTGAASEVNDLATQVANLNAAIVSASPHSAEQADMQDQRDRIVERLSYLIGAQQTIRTDGQAAVYVGGRLLVDNTTTASMKATSNQLQWEDTGSMVASGGYVGQLHTLVNTTIPGYRTQLDQVALKLVTDVNALHTAGADASGTTGRIFFAPGGTTAASIALSTDPTNGVAGHPERLAAASATGGVNDGSNATTLSNLADQTNGIDDKYYAFLASIGVATRTTRSKADAQELSLQSAREDLKTVSEVNIDDELADLTAAQRAYQASARVVTTIDEMLSDLISNFGRVGR
jgi:flagellar hook-associated protein 1 FlgK